MHLPRPGDFVAFDRPGHVLIALSFELASLPDGRTRLSTETRVKPTDDAAARAFSRYWAVIHLGGNVIRLDLLRGIRPLAENTVRSDRSAASSGQPSR